MSSMLRALSAEALKLRGTLALWMCLIAPATVVALLVLQLTFSDLSKRTPEPPLDAWRGFAAGVLHVWSFLMLPLFITLQAALLAGLEHANHQWKHLLALPVPRGVHYLAKQTALIALLALAMLVLFALIPLGGAVAGVLQPRWGIAGMPPWWELAKNLVAPFVGAMLIVALHTWLSLRWRSFTVAVAIGMTATVIGFIAMQSRHYGFYYPWAMPISTLAGEGVHLGFVVKASLIGGLLVTLAGLWSFVRREDR